MISWLAVRKTAQNPCMKKTSFSQTAAKRRETLNYLVAKQQIQATQPHQDSCRCSIFSSNLRKNSPSKGTKQPQSSPSIPIASVASIHDLLVAAQKTKVDSMVMPPVMFSKDGRHVMATWPESADFSLWPYTLHYAMQFYNRAPVLEDSFLGTQTGTCLKVEHVFEGSIFALQNSIPTSNNTLCLSPDMWPRLKFIPNLISLGRTYQVTTHMTTDILPTYYFSLHQFFKSICHIQHDVTMSTIWKKSSGQRKSSTPKKTKEWLRFFYQTSIATKSEDNDSIEFICNLDPIDGMNTPTVFFKLIPCINLREYSSETRIAICLYTFSLEGIPNASVWCMPSFLDVEQLKSEE